MATATRKPRTSAKAKQKCLGFVNWQVGNIRSRKGFALFDNEYLTREDQALLDLAAQHGGSVTIKAELRISLNQEPKELDLSSIEIVESNQTAA